VEVVGNEVDDLAGGHLGVHSVKEGDEPVAATTRIDLAEDAPGAHFEGGKRAS